MFGCAWLARKFGFNGVKRGGIVKMVDDASLGSNKERVAIVEVGDTWLVLGAGPGNVRLLLHTMPVGSAEAGRVGTTAAPDARTLQGDFGQRFPDTLAGEANKKPQKFGGGK